MPGSSQVPAQGMLYFWPQFSFYPIQQRNAQKGTGKNQSSINTEKTPETSSQSESLRGSEDSDNEEPKVLSADNVKNMFGDKLELPNHEYFECM